MSDLIPSNHEMTVFSQMAAAAEKSPHYKRWGGRDGILMILLTARELGLPPMSALNGGINLIQGKPELSARAMSAVIRRAGHEIKVTACHDDLCQLVGKRKDTGEEMTVSFHIEEARRSGLVRQNSPWTKTPSDMLFARALSRLARRLFSDVIGTAYVTGEIPREDNTEHAEPLVEIEVDAADKELVTNDHIRILCDHLNEDRKQKLKEHFEINDLSELTVGDYNSIMAKLAKEGEKE